MDTDKENCVASMLTEEEQARTLRLDNLPCWANEEYLCLCFYLFDSVPLPLPGSYVEIGRYKQEGRSSCYGFMTFETREAAERILQLYNGLETMPGTSDRFCLNWMFVRSKERTLCYINIRSKKSFKKSSRSKKSSIQHVETPPNSRPSGPVNFGTFQKAVSREYIPLDLMENIFLRLPTESIVRFRRVCKAWACMTRAPHFTSRRLENRRSLSDPIIALGHTHTCNIYLSLNHSMENFCSYRTIYFEFPYGFRSPRMKVCNTSNSCNGLVCIYSSCGSAGFASVVNPTVRETVQLPKSFAFSKRGTSRGAFSMGLGYDDCSDTYKIIRIFEGHDFFKLGRVGSEYEVFTLGSATSNCHWRHLGYIPYYVRIDKPPVFVHGTIYWLVSDSHSRTRAYSILSVDIRTETSCTFSIPEVVKHYSLMELEGYLCILCADEKFSKANLYVLEDYVNFKWVKKHTIERLPIGFINPIARGDGEIYFTSIYGNPGGLCYQTKSGILGKVTSSSIFLKTFVSSRSVRGCAESLVSPILYLQRSTVSCVSLSIFDQRWATPFPTSLSCRFD